MKLGARLSPLLLGGIIFFSFASFAHADALTLTSGNNATTTPNVATSITGFQIVGNAASTTPVKIHVTNGTVRVPVVSGVTTSGNDTATLNLSGTVTNLNTALSSLSYSRSSTGTDTLEVALVSSNQIYFPDNGHVYQYVNSALSWTNAKTAAEALTAYGAQGYLVTITSLAENNFVKARLAGDAWIGASDAASEGDWKWVTGPEAGTSFWSGAGGGSTVGGNYASWNAGEPNNSSEEDCGEEYVADGTWNDLDCVTDTVAGYVAEFGSVASPVTVVSKNVSIVTADVPAVTSLTPANSATNVNTSANLVMGFSKTVTAGAGNILIQKYSDDSVFQTIAASSSQVTGTGTNTITIDPTGLLEEGTQYYVTVASTSFKDASNNYFDGISAKTTWVFTTGDFTAPVISTIATTSIATTTTSIGWNTNEAASTKVVYSTGNSFASTTSETDTSPRVTTHVKALSGLTACTSYNFKVVSGDSAGNYATSTSALFTTLGCPGNSVPSSATTTSASVSSTATSTLTDSGRTITVTTPSNFTATSSSVVIQIKAQVADPVLAVLGVPGNLSSATGVLFNVTALINNDTVLDSFDRPVTITYAYTDADITGLDESTLSMYHYHNGAWLKLDDCSVNASANTITCTTPSFSIFSIFGSAPVTASGSRARSGGTIQSQVEGLRNKGKTAEADKLVAQWYWLFPKTAGAAAVLPTSTTTAPAGPVSVRDLKSGMTGEDVRNLQKLLTAAGYPIATTGIGALGNETIYFGSLTKAALSKFQAAKGITPAGGYFGPLTRERMKELGLGKVWW